MTRFLAFLFFSAFCLQLLAFESLTINEAENRYVVQDEFNRSSNGFYAEIDTDLFLGQKTRRRGSGGRVWSNFYYGSTKLEPKNLDFDIKPDMYGIQLGFDVVKSHGVYDTFFGNYTRSSTELCDYAKSKIENYMFGYGKYIYLKGCHFGGAAAISYDEYKVRRSVFDNDGNGKGLQTNLFGEFGIDVILGQWAIKPFYALQYDFLYHGRIGEKGNAFRSDSHGDSFSQLFGSKLNWKPLDSLEFQLRTTWIHELLGETPSFFHARFSPVQGTMTPAIYFYDGKIGRDWAWIGLSLKWEMAFNIFLYLDYDCLINRYQTTHFGNVGLCLGW